MGEIMPVEERENLRACVMPHVYLADLRIAGGMFLQLGVENAAHCEMVAIGASAIFSNGMVTPKMRD